MQRAFFLISATTGCVNDLASALRENERVQEAWKVFSGEHDVIAIVRSDELGSPPKELSSLIDFNEWLGNLSDEYYDEEKEEFVEKKLVHKVSFNLISPDSGPDFANLDGPSGSYLPRGEAMK